MLLWDLENLATFPFRRNAYADKNVEYLGDTYHPINENQLRTPQMNYTSSEDRKN